MLQTSHAQHSVALRSGHCNVTPAHSYSPVFSRRTSPSLARAIELGPQMPSEPNQYELQRQQLPKRKQKKRAAVSHEPTRHSSRLHPDSGGADPEASELALCIVNGTCPRCGKFVDVGHKKHLEHCSGSRARKQQEDALGHVEIEGLEELEAAEEQNMDGNKEDLDTRPAKKSKPSRGQAEKLKELELSGLVDFDKSHARFAVIGSTGSHYHVELKEPAPSCQCVDYRIRRRICKHQKLVLLQLGIPDTPQDWYKAVSSKLDELAQAEPTDRQSHLGETEYDHDYEQPAPNSSKSTKAAPKRAKSARTTSGGRSTNKQHADRDAQKMKKNHGDDENGSDSSDQMEQEEEVTDSAQKPAASRGGLSPAGLAWPKRPPRGK